MCLFFFLLIFFLFKQKTAYEMRISDWSSDVCSSDLAARKYWRLSDYSGQSLSGPGAAPAIEPLRQDLRFTDPAWKEPPFNLIVQAFLLNQQWWHAATAGIGGVSRHHEDMVESAARQILDVFAPTNFLATYPLLQRKIVETGGRCVVDGDRKSTRLNSS